MVEQKRPFLGCAYYPEDWDEAEIPKDIERMKNAGITCARIGEFAWRKMEPEEGKYEFDWLHNVIDALYENGISVILGTPTACPPIWLSRKHPEMYVLDENGTRRLPGGRRNCCSNNPAYIAACYKIVEAMGKEFGKDKNVIGWQIDNEIQSWGKGCVCEYCMEKFRATLKRDYKTIENLNASWNLNLFSQAYDSFDDVPPAVHSWHNPHINNAWAKAHNEADLAFIHSQAKILKKYTDAPIGTDMMPTNGLDYEKMVEPLDVVMFNHYNTRDNLNDAVFWFNYLRTLKGQPFWNTETATCWNGAEATGQVIPPEGFCRINSWLPVALGGEANMYWLFRQHWAGHELIHGSIYYANGRPLHVLPEVQKTAEEFDKAADFIKATKVVSDVAIHFTSKNWNLFESEGIVNGMSYMGEHYRFHNTLLSAGINPDVIGAKHSVNEYKLIFSPYMMTLEDENLPEKMEEWVKAGGVWVVGPMSDIRTAVGAHYTDKAMGMLERLTGVTLDFSLPTDGTVVKAAWSDGEPLETRRWMECHAEGGEALAIVKEGYSSLNGKTVIGRYKVGKGKIILLGTFLSDKDLLKLFDIALKDAGVEPIKISGKVVAARRVGNGMEGLAVAETGYAPAKITLSCDMTDLISGKVYHRGENEIAPYAVAVFVGIL